MRRSYPVRTAQLYNEPRMHCPHCMHASSYCKSCNCHFIEVLGLVHKHDGHSVRPRRRTSFPPHLRTYLDLSTLKEPQQWLTDRQSKRPSVRLLHKCIAIPTWELQICFCDSFAAAFSNALLPCSCGRKRRAGARRGNAVLNATTDCRPRGSCGRCPLPNVAELPQSPTNGRAEGEHRRGGVQQPGRRFVRYRA